MKHIIIAVSLASLIVAGCSSFKCSIGAGYRKTPPGLPHSIMPLSGKGLTTFNPQQIDWLIKLLGSEEIIKALFPVNNRVDLGVWVDIDTQK